MLSNVDIKYLLKLLLSDITNGGYHTEEENKRYHRLKKYFEAQQQVKVEPEVKVILAEIEGYIEPYYLKQLQQEQKWTVGFSKNTRSKNQEIFNVMPETIYKYLDNVYATEDYRKIKVTFELLDDSKISA